jgi:hypothetical protein
MSNDDDDEFEDLFEDREESVMAGVSTGDTYWCASEFGYMLNAGRALCDNSSILNSSHTALLHCHCAHENLEGLVVVEAEAILMKGRHSSCVVNPHRIRIKSLCFFSPVFQRILEQR